MAFLKGNRKQLKAFCCFPLSIDLLLKGPKFKSHPYWNTSRR